MDKKKYVEKTKKRLVVPDYQNLKQIWRQLPKYGKPYRTKRRTLGGEKKVRVPQSPEAFMVGETFIPGFVERVTTEPYVRVIKRRLLLTEEEKQALVNQLLKIIFPIMNINREIFILGWHKGWLSTKSIYTDYEDAVKPIMDYLVVLQQFHQALIKEHVPFLRLNLNISKLEQKFRIVLPVSFKNISRHRFITPASFLHKVGTSPKVDAKLIRKTLRLYFRSMEDYWTFWYKPTLDSDQLRANRSLFFP